MPVMRVGWKGFLFLVSIQTVSILNIFEDGKISAPSRILPSSLTDLGRPHGRDL